MTKKELEDQWQDLKFRLWEALKGVDATPGRVMGFDLKARALSVLSELVEECHNRTNHEDWKTQIFELSHDD